MGLMSLAVSVLGFIVAFSTKSGAVMAFGLLLGFGGLFAALFAFAAARVASTARPDSTLLTDKDINALRAAVRKPGTTSGASPPATNS